METLVSFPRAEVNAERKVVKRVKKVVKRARKVVKRVAGKAERRVVKRLVNTKHAPVSAHLYK